MFEITKKAVKKAFQIGQILFSMGPGDFNNLVELTSNIKFPSERQIKMAMKSGADRQVAIAGLIEDQYINIATRNGYSSEQGKAMFEYVAMLEDMK